MFLAFMLILSDMLVIHRMLAKYTDFSSSWEARVKEAEDRVAGYNWRLVEVAEWESKLKGELVALWNFYDS